MTNRKSNKIRKDLVNEVLKQFSVILQSFKPNLTELDLIQAKFDSMVEKNLRGAISRSQRSRESSKAGKEEKWYRIKVE